MMFYKVIVYLIVTSADPILPHFAQTCSVPCTEPAMVHVRESRGPRVPGSMGTEEFTLWLQPPWSD